jgi:hypothetical protein
LRRIKFGGVVGKQAFVTVVSVLSLGGAVWRIESVALQTACIVLAFAVAMTGLLCMSFYGHRHPVEATLEGTEMVAWQHQVLEVLAAKAAPSIPEGPPVSGVPAESRGAGSEGGT